MDMWTYIDQHPVYTVFLGLFVLIVLAQAYNFLFTCWNRFLRHRTIRECGWPPSHLDADGDWKGTKDE